MKAERWASGLTSGGGVGGHSGAWSAHLEQFHMVARSGTGLSMSGCAL